MYGRIAYPQPLAQGWLRLSSHILGSDLVFVQNQPSTTASIHLFDDTSTNASSSTAQRLHPESNRATRFCRPRQPPDHGAIVNLHIEWKGSGGDAPSTLLRVRSSAWRLFGCAAVLRHDGLSERLRIQVGGRPGNRTLLRWFWRPPGVPSTSLPCRPQPALAHSLSPSW